MQYSSSLAVFFSSLLRLTLAFSSTAASPVFSSSAAFFLPVVTATVCTHNSWRPWPAYYRLHCFYFVAPSLCFFVLFFGPRFVGGTQAGDRLRPAGVHRPCNQRRVSTAHSTTRRDVSFSCLSVCLSACLPVFCRRPTDVVFWGYRCCLSCVRVYNDQRV